jgi:hypothetical protein
MAVLEEIRKQVFVASCTWCSNVVYSFFRVLSDSIDK